MPISAFFSFSILYEALGALYVQLKNINKLSGFKNIINLIPGISNVMSKIKESKFDFNNLKRQEAMAKKQVKLGNKGLTSNQFNTFKNLFS